MIVGLQMFGISFVINLREVHSDKKQFLSQWIIFYKHFKEFSFMQA